MGTRSGGVPELVFAAIGILAIRGFLFSSLTIQITAQVLRWQFGPCLNREEVLLHEVERVEAIETTFLQGWGIHHTSRGWPYNASGLPAVTVKL